MDMESERSQETEGECPLKPPAFGLVFLLVYMTTLCCFGLQISQTEWLLWVQLMDTGHLRPCPLRTLPHLVFTDSPGAHGRALLLLYSIGWEVENQRGLAT